MQWLRIVGIIIGIFLVVSITGCVPSQPTCADGVAVPDPQANPGLVSDCMTLLQAKDTLAGSAELNWSGNRAIAEWDGITISGLPLRVTALVLPERNLSGTVPPELGSLSNLRGCVKRSVMSVGAAGA